MNKRINKQFLLFANLLWLYLACSHPDKKTEDPGYILNRPPFAHITDSIRQFPKDANLYQRRASLLSQNNLHDLAGADFKLSWELQPSEQTAIQYASNLSITGKIRDEMNLLEQSLRLFPDSKDLNRVLADAYSQSGRNADALKVYEEDLRKDSMDFETWYEKGILLAKMKDTPQAITALKAAYRIQPTFTYALELAHIYAESKNRKALELCDYVLAADSLHQTIDPFFIKGIYYSNTLQYNQAISQFDSCIGRDWKFTEAYIEKGIAFYKVKNYDVALNTFRMAATVSNTDPDAYFWMGRCYEVIQKKEEALAYYQRALSLDKNFSEAKDAINRVKK